MKKKSRWKYDWDEIQKFYDDNHTWRDILDHYGVSNRSVQKAVRDGRLITRTPSEAAKLFIRKFGPRQITEEGRKRISIQQSISNSSGGKCKWYDVGGIKVQGTWERDVALKLNELNIEWKRPNKPFLYVIDGKLKRYTPDFFIVKDNVYLEIKGRWWGNDREKMKAVITQNPGIKIVVVRKDGVEKILEGEQVWSLCRSEEPKNRVRFSDPLPNTAEAD